MKKMVYEQMEVDWSGVDATHVIKTLQEMVQKHGDIVIEYNYYGNCMAP